MTFNTGNPIGSTDARDLSDNAENFDKALNSTAETWTDRLGVTRDTFEGALSKLSFYRVGTFAAGYTLTNMRQTLEYSGHEYGWAGTFPKVVAAGATPATSGGIGAGAWVDRTDLTLRGELTENGATIEYISNYKNYLEARESTNLQLSVDSGVVFIDYIGATTSVIIPQYTNVYVNNVNSVDISFSLNEGAVATEIKNGSIIKYAYDTKTSLVDNHSSSIVTPFVSVSKNDFIDYGYLLLNAGVSFDSVELQSGRYRITSNDLGTFPDPYYKRGVIYHNNISYSIGNQIFISDEGAIFTRIWDITSGQPTYKKWSCVSLGHILQNDAYPTSGEDLNNYTTPGRYRLNDNSALNKPPITGDLVGLLDVSSNPGRSYIVQNFSFYRNGYNVRYQRQYTASAWSEWYPYTQGSLYVPSVLINDSFTFGSVLHPINIRVNTGTTTPVDGPLGTPCFGILKVIADDQSSYILQTFHSFSASQPMHTRYSTNGGSSWSAWVQH